MNGHMNVKFLIQLDHNQIYICLIQITVTNFSETHFSIIFHSVIHLTLGIWVFCDVMLVVGWRFPLFQRNILPPSSSATYHQVPWRRHYVPVKCCEPLTAQPIDITLQETQILSSMAMRTSNLELPDALLKKKTFIFYEPNPSLTCSLFRYLHARHQSWNLGW